MVEKNPLCLYSGVKKELQAGDTLPGGGGGGDSISKSITETAHGFVVGDAVYFDGTNWLKAISSSTNTLATGLVSAVTDVNTFTFQLAGYLSLTTGQWDAVTGETGGLTAGAFYFIDPTTAGFLTQTEPTISNPIIQAISTTEVNIFPYRPSVATESNLVPVFSVSKTSDQTITYNTDTLVTWENIDIDSTNDFNLSTNRYYIPVAGKYIFIANLDFTPITDQKRYMTKISKNGSIFKTMAASSVSGTSSPILSGVCILDLVVNDYIQIYAYHNDNVATNTVYGSSGGFFTYFSGHRIGP